MVPQVKDPNGGIQTSIKGMMDTFSDCMRKKYSPIQVDEECFRRMAEAGHRRLWWTKERLAWILRTDPSRTPKQWILSPNTIYCHHNDAKQYYGH